MLRFVMLCLTHKILDRPHIRLTKRRKAQPFCADSGTHPVKDVFIQVSGLLCPSAVRNVFLAFETDLTLQSGQGTLDTMPDPNLHLPFAPVYSNPLAKSISEAVCWKVAETGIDNCPSLFRANTTTS
jgi:hypothetical protein